MQSIWAKFNGWIDQSFTEIHNPVTGDIEKVLNPTGDDLIKKAIDNISSMFSSIADFLTSDGMQGIPKTAGGVAVDQFRSFMAEIEAIVNIFGNLSKGDFGGAYKDFKKWQAYMLTGDAA
jgi:hypothetical protein